MPLATTRTTVPVVVDNDKCIADKGCTVCVDVCPLASLPDKLHERTHRRTAGLHLPLSGRR